MHKCPNCGNFLVEFKSPHVIVTYIDDNWEETTINMGKLKVIGCHVCLYTKDDTVRFY